MKYINLIIIHGIKEGNKTEASHLENVILFESGDEAEDPGSPPTFVTSANRNFSHRTLQIKIQSTQIISSIYLTIGSFHIKLDQKNVKMDCKNADFE